MRLCLDLLEKDISQEAKIVDDLIVSIWDQIEIIMPKISEYENIILTGCGDSFFAAIYGQYLLENISKIRAYAENAYECYKYSNIHDGDLMIAISASGQTGVTVAAAKKARKNGAKIVGITCNKSGLLLKYSDERIILDIHECVPIPTTSSMGALMTLASLSIWFGLVKNRLYMSEYEELRKGIMMISKQMQRIYNMSSKIKKISNMIHEQNSDRIYLVGGGPNYVTALFGMAKLRELKVFHSYAFELEEFIHYGNIPLEKNDVCVLIATGHSKKRLLSAVNLLESIGSSIICISDDKICEEAIILPRINELLFPPIGLLTIHLLALYCAKMKWGNSIKIDHWEKASEIIKISDI